MGPARPAGLRGECPPASALRRLPPPLFRPEGLRATPDCGSQAWEKARLPCFAPLKRSASWNAGERILFVGRKPFHACDSCKPDVGHIHTALCARIRSEEHTSELQSLMRISYADFCLKKKKNTYKQTSK